MSYEKRRYRYTFMSSTNEGNPPIAINVINETMKATIKPLS